MKCRTGETQRIISFTALGIRASGLARSASICCGFSNSASRPPAATELVVSWPAVAMMM